MVSNASISGLASGLDTASIINQLMQLEAAPQTQLKGRVASEQGIVSVLQSLNAKVAQLGTQAQVLAKATAWTPVVTNSSDSGVTVTADPGAATTQLSVTVTGIARTHQLGFANGAALTDVVTGSSTTVRLDRFDGSPVVLDTGDGTLQGLINAINDPAAQTGLHASAIPSGSGTYRLLVESVQTGAAQDFDLTAADGSALLGGATVRAGSDASIDLGAGISVTSTTNTFADLQPGVSITLGPQVAVGEVATVTVSRDTAKVSSAVSSFVDAINGLLGTIDDKSAYDTASGQAGPLMGDPNVRSLRNALVDAVYPADGTSLSSIGIEVDRQGKLTFDAKEFATAYAADPAGVTARFTGATDGFASKVAALADRASDPLDGTITAAITGRNSGIKRLQDSIEDWDRRLEMRRDDLTRQFTALETAMNQMTSQSNWLAGQLGSLPSPSAG